MRTNMMKGFHQQNITYGMPLLPTSQVTMAGGNAQHLCPGFVETGKHQQALEIYAEQGDMASIKVLARNYRNLAGIQSIYLKNPNSAMLTYLVQDFVNNCQQTIDSRNQNPIDKEWIEEIGAKVIYQKEALNFITFANKVIAETRRRILACGVLPPPCSIISMDISRKHGRRLVKQSPWMEHRE